MILPAKSKHVPDRVELEEVSSIEEVSSVEDISSIKSVSSDEDEISEYEKAALRRREENRQLMKKLQIYRVRACHYIIVLITSPILQNMANQLS